MSLKHFPDAVEVQQMWSRWVHKGAFDGKPSIPTDLARYLGDAHKEGLPGWERVNEALRSHVRKSLRSGDKQKVVVAVDHIQAAVDKGAPILASLLRETEGASASAEWNERKKHDRDSAEWMRWYVFEFAKEAAGDRDWLRAWKSAKQMVAFEEQRRRILAKDKQESKGDG